MGFLYFLEGLRNDFCNGFFSLITELGGESAFLVIAIALYWCIDRRAGLYTMCVGLYGTLANQALKLTFRIPRPWVLDPNFTIVEQAREAATGYSFPSGHTQNVTGTFSSLALFFRKRWVTVVSAVLIVMVAFSRMYLGVHTPLDVGVSLVLAVALALLLQPTFTDEERFRRRLPYLLLVGVVLSAVFMLVVFLLPEAGFDPHNLTSGKKNACTLLGALLGFMLAFYIDQKRGGFETSAAWYVQLLKLVVGFALVLVIKSLLKTPLELLCLGNVYVARSLRYFLIALFAGALWPMTFPLLRRLEKKKGTGKA